MYEETEEIDLVSLFFTVLHKYRQILAVAMICAVCSACWVCTSTAGAVPMQSRRWSRSTSRQ